jgi:hypothetical protein
VTEDVDLVAKVEEEDIEWLGIELSLIIDASDWRLAPRDENKKVLAQDRSLVEDCGVLEHGRMVVAVDELDEEVLGSEERSISSATDLISSGEVRERDMDVDTRYGGAAAILTPLWYVGGLDMMIKKL